MQTAEPDSIDEDCVTVQTPLRKVSQVSQLTLRQHIRTLLLSSAEGQEVLVVPAFDRSRQLSFARCATQPHPTGASTRGEDAPTAVRRSNSTAGGDHHGARASPCGQGKAIPDDV